MEVIYTIVKAKYGFDIRKWSLKYNSVNGVALNEFANMIKEHFDIPKFLSIMLKYRDNGNIRTLAVKFIPSLHLFCCGRKNFFN